jgi:hypothetical protein
MASLGQIRPAYQRTSSRSTHIGVYARCSGYGSADGSGLKCFRYYSDHDARWHSDWNRVLGNRTGTSLSAVWFANPGCRFSNRVPVRGNRKTYKSSRKRVGRKPTRCASSLFPKTLSPSLVALQAGLYTIPQVVPFWGGGILDILRLHQQPPSQIKYIAYWNPSSNRQAVGGVNL